MADSLLSFFATAERRAQRPWPRYRLSLAHWQALVERLASAGWTLLGLWAETAEVHAALLDEAAREIAVASLACPDRRFPSLSAARPSAQRLERAAQDLFGLTAEGLSDARPWLDHGQWRRRPFGDGAAAARPASAYDFLPVLGESLHQIPVGPVHAGIIEPGHFRFHCSGETVVRLEERLGYVHKGTEALMVGKPPAEAARLAARRSGDATVAHSLAFARAVEAALGIEPPPRAVWLRALMAELERIANHIGDVGAICNDASFILMQAQCTVLRERVLRAAGQCFGHRLMMDRVVPGGLACELDEAGVLRLRELVAEIAQHWPELLRIYDNRPSLLDRMVTTGTVRPELVRRFGAGGHVGRASGRGLDARRLPGYPPYDGLDFEVPVLTDGDVHSRVLIRFREVTASLGLISQILERLPAGPIAAAVPARAGEGMALTESFRGDVLAWVRLDEAGRIARAHARDPSWFQWPLLEAAIEGNIVADFPLCNKSFNCSYSGHDL
ncbi:MAG TPA: nickel-dependent hydrogenase large subunit [Stellaceae bacterium]|nr:nickel-dependent hydrogenase large subunit [Stellaceae bacterium]